MRKRCQKFTRSLMDAWGNEICAECERTANA
jgi:hypothetical protein